MRVRFPSPAPLFRFQLTFPVLSDVGSKVARKFGIVLELSDILLELYPTFGHALEDANGESGKRELPVPGTFLTDGNGTIRLTHVDADYTRRLDPDDVVGTLKRLDSAEAGGMSIEQGKMQIAK